MVAAALSAARLLSRCISPVRQKLALVYGGIASALKQIGAVLDRAPLRCVEE